MLCAISGEPAEQPVVSKKTGVVYEKRLIEKYLAEHDGREPGSSGSDEELDAETDLLPLKTGASTGVVRPRPPTLTSIPALLATFQNEWDALALETYTLQEQLSQTRMELATALYQHDAAIRVIARLTRERDEARDALARVTVAGGAAATTTTTGGEDAMAVDSEELPEGLATTVDETHKRLSKSRKKRTPPPGWVTADALGAFTALATDALPVARATSLTVAPADAPYAAVGGLDGTVAVYAVTGHAVERTLAVGAPVTSLLWAAAAAAAAGEDKQPLLVGTAKGAVQFVEGGVAVASLQEHAGAVTGLAVHPSGALLASVGADKTVVLYDVAARARVSRAHSSSSLTACAFHPDGHLLAAGTTAGELEIYLVKTGDLATSFALGAPVQALAFSENGFWIAATAKGQTTVTIFDLRKEGDAATAKVLDIGSAVAALAWDGSGQFLATAGPAGVTVQHYAKSSKSWSQALSSATPAVAVQWGAEAKQLLSVNEDGVVTVTGVKEDPSPTINLRSQPTPASLARRRPAFYEELEAWQDFGLDEHDIDELVNVEWDDLPADAAAMDGRSRTPAIIDLTDEPDSPVLVGRRSDYPDYPQPPHRRPRDPRGGAGAAAAAAAAAQPLPARASVIDLTDDADDVQVIGATGPPPRWGGGDGPNNPNRPAGGGGGGGRDPPNGLFGMRFMGLGGLNGLGLNHLPALSDLIHGRRANNNSNNNNNNSSSGGGGASAFGAIRPPSDAMQELIDLDAMLQEDRRLDYLTPAEHAQMRQHQEHLRRLHQQRQNMHNPNPFEFSQHAMGGGHNNNNNMNNHGRARQQQQHQQQHQHQHQHQRQHQQQQNPLGRNLPDLNYQMNGLLHQFMGVARIGVPGGHNHHHHHHHHPPPHGFGGGGVGLHGLVDDKPPYEPPPPAATGFTRDTEATGDDGHSDEPGDAMVVCAGCERELVYDPKEEEETTMEQGGSDGAGAPPAKRVRNRRDREEHHFWAVAECGHVYCKWCYDNRREAFKGDGGSQSQRRVAFRTAGKVLQCAVPCCETDVTAKKAWVGLFV